MFLAVLNTVYGAHIISTGKKFIENGSDGALNTSTVGKKLQPIANVLMGAASVVFVGVGLVMGVNFMIKGPDEKAKMKERLIWYVIAMVLVYGIIAIYNIIAAIYTNIIS